MGQQQPYYSQFQQGFRPPGMQLPPPQVTPWGIPPAPYTAGMPMPQRPAPRISMPGMPVSRTPIMDPQQMAAAQQALANPNAGDGFRPQAMPGAAAGSPAIPGISGPAIPGLSPEQMNQAMANPMIQQLMQNPAIAQGVQKMMANPQALDGKAIEAMTQQMLSDPKAMAEMQKLMQDPNAMANLQGLLGGGRLPGMPGAPGLDGEKMPSLLPDGQGFLLGGALGIAATQLLNMGTNPDHSLSDGVVNGLKRFEETVPGIKPVNDFLQSRVIEPISRSRWGQEMLNRVPVAEVEKDHLQRLIASTRGQVPEKVYQALKSVETATELENKLLGIRRLYVDEGKILRQQLEHLPKTVSEKALERVADRGIFKRMAVAWRNYWHRGGLPEEAIRAVRGAKTLEAARWNLRYHLSQYLNQALTMDTVGELRNAISLDHASKILAEAVDPRFKKTLTREILENIQQAGSYTESKQLAQKALLEADMGLAGRFFAKAETAAQKAATEAMKTKSGYKKLPKVLSALTKGKDRLRNYLELYKPQHKIAQSELGPVGRGIASLYGYVRSTLAGEVMKPISSTESAGLLGRMNPFNSGSSLLGPFMLWGLVAGLALTKAHQAEDGDKVKSFFHEFLGTGVGSFVGWTWGRKILYGMAQKLPNVALKFLKMPLPVIGKGSWLGLGIELIAMFGVGEIFRTLGEKVSNGIFGKPKSVLEEELKKQGRILAKPLPRGNDTHGTGTQLQKDHFQRFNQPQPASGPSALDMAKPPLSITPEEIMQSPAAQTQEQLSNSIINNIDSRWDLLMSDGGGGH